VTVQCAMNRPSPKTDSAREAIEALNRKLIEGVVRHGARAGRPVSVCAGC